MKAAGAKPARPGGIIFHEEGIWEDLKGCLRAKLVEARADWKYSQEEMAEALDLPALREKAPPAPRRGWKTCG